MEFKWYKSIYFALEKVWKKGYLVL